MDEENQGFAIPANKPMFDEGDVSIEARPLPESEYFMVFANDVGDKAVILTPVESVGDEILERHGRSELEEYAKALLDTGEDPMELQIGDVFEGESAEADAKAEAFRLDEEFAPAEGATDEEIIAAIDAARTGAVPEEEETFPEDLAGGEDIGAPELGAGPEIPEAEPEETEPIGDEDTEPMLGQLMKKKKPAV